MGRRELISVIIPTFNAECYIEDTLRSALQQTYEPIEVIVIDDGSTDGTLANVKIFACRVRILQQANFGVCAARNAAAKEAKGTFLAFLDADDLWERDKLQRQMAIFGQNPEVGVVATWFDEIDQYEKKVERGRKKPWHFLDRVIDLHREFLLRGNFLCVSSCLIRRDAFFEAGGFYTRERILSGDYDLWIRLSERHRFFVVSETLCHYRVLANSQIHGSLNKEYGAQLKILRMHQHRFSSLGYRKRLSTLYRDWADSAFFEGHLDGWPKWRKAVRLNPFGGTSWLLGARIAVARVLKWLNLSKMRRSRS